MFEDIIGHENVKKILKENIENNMLSHAYLFSGAEGVGKKALAIEFAKQLLNTQNLEACVDFKFIEKLEDKKDIIVEQIRDKLVNDVYIAPATNTHKVYIINDAHLMNASCQNALLKTLEEPPKYVVIILITHMPQALLKTVLSRVNKITFNGLSNSDIDYITNEKLGKTLDFGKKEYVSGSAKLALELLEDEEDNKYAKIDKLYNAYKAEDRLEMIKLLEGIDFKEDVFNYLEYVFLQNKEYDKIPLIEGVRLKMQSNANELIAKQGFVIKLLRKE